MSKLRQLPKQYFPLISEDNRIDNIEVIRMYLISGDDSIQLTEKQQALKERYDFADNLMRQNIYTYNQIEQILIKKFNISIDTARKAVAAAQYLYGSLHSRDKKYLLMQHFDLMQQTAQKLIAAGRYKEAEGFSKLMLDCIKELPERSEDANRAAAIVYNFAGIYNELSDTPMDKQKALAIAQRFLEAEETAPVNE